MKHQTVLWLFAFLGAGPRADVGVPTSLPNSHATSVQGTVAPTGRWTGTSTCLVRPSACKDEQVVYYVERTGEDSAGTTPEQLTANKVVNGREEDMGVLTCRFVRATQLLLCPMPPQFPPGEWRFTLHGSELQGGLWRPDGTKFRTVQVRYAADQKPKPS